MTKRNSGNGDDQAARVERILEAFEVLRLPKARDRFKEIVEVPEPNTTRIEWLFSILEPQLVARIEARIERRIRESRLPERKTLAAFDFDFQRDLDKDLVLDLSTLGFVDMGWNVLLAGWSGTGKSHIAMALALNGCMANRRVRYTTSEDLLKTLCASLADDSLEEALKPFVRPELLVIDEVGLEQVERIQASRAGLMQKVLIPRYQKHLSTIVTSNIDWEDWGDYLGDHLGAAAILDRLIHRSHVITIEGPSYRGHEHETKDPRRKPPGKESPEEKPSEEKPPKKKASKEKRPPSK